MKHRSGSKTRTFSSVRSFFRKAVIVAGIAAMAGLVIVPAASAATPAPAAHTQLGGWGGVAILNNLSPYPITLSSASGVWSTNGAPSQHKVYPGYTSDWSMAAGWISSNGFKVVYQFTNAAGDINYVHTSLTDPGNEVGGRVSCTVTGWDSIDWSCDSTGNSWTLDSTFTLHASKASQTVSQGNKNAFAQALSSVCNGPNGANGQATCSFNATSDPTYHLSLTGQTPADAKDLPGCAINGNDATYTQEDGISTTTSYANQIGTSASIGIDGLVTAGISHNQTWGKAWTQSKQYLYAQPMHADHGKLAIPRWFPNVATVTGNFTATLDGTTYHLNNVQITGRGVAGGGSGNYITSQVQVPMTSTQYQAWCGHANTAR